MALLNTVLHFFTPRHSNNHKARILHPFILCVFVAIFIVSQFFLTVVVHAQPAVLGFASSITPERIIELSNKKRMDEGLVPLTINVKLNEAARRKAADMFAFNYWAHVSPSGRSPWVFFQEVGYKYVYAGENLARDFLDSEGAVSAWMNSPTHRDNLLNFHYREIGVAVVDGTLNGVETTLVVQLFGTPSNTVSGAGSANQPTINMQLITDKHESTQQPIIRQKQIAGSETGSRAFSPFLLTKTVAVFIMGVVLGALIVDALFVFRKKIVRLSGRNMAHLLFVGGLLLMAILTGPGAIL